MKVLQIINSLGTGGAEKLLLDTVPMYNALGIEMDILILWNNQHQFTEALVQQNICKVHILHQSTNVKDIYKPGNILKIAKILKEYDIAHVHLFPAQYFCVIANMINGNKTKLLFTEHNTTNSRIAKSYFKPLEKWVYKRYEKLICITEEIKSIYTRYLQFPEAYYQVILNGVNIKAIQNAIPYKKHDLHASFTDQDIILLQVSAFRPQKDQPTLIKSLVNLPQHVKLILVGDGDTRKECEELVSQLSLQERVLFFGQRMDIPRLLKSAEIIVLSTHYEGLSLASIEAMASSKPFVASDVPGLSELVKGAGVLFTLGDDVMLSNKIKQLIDDSSYRESIVTTCEKRAAHYDIEKLVQQHINLYKQCIQK